MPLERRDFLKRALYTLLGLLGLGFLIPAGRLLVPVPEQEKETVFFPLIAEDEIPRVGVKKAELSYTALGRPMKARVFLVSSSPGLVAFSATCSHLGCLVNYRKDRREFVCPCHGGTYDITGKNISGPPPAPLKRFPVTIKNGMAYIGMKI